MNVPVSVEDFAAKLAAGERLARDEAERLELSRDLVTLGMLADDARQRRHGRAATFLRVADFPLEADKRPGDISTQAGEVRIVGTPPSISAAVDATRAARTFARGVPLSGFSLSDLEALADPLSSVLSALKDAGLELIAEAPLDTLKFPERALENLSAAGLAVARLTVRHPSANSWDICKRAVALQEAFGSLRAFAPLARSHSSAQPTTGYDDVKRVALARLLVDNIATIQVDWSLYGPKLAQVALTFGADDLDAVSAVDDESRGHRRSPLEEIRRSIEAAWLEPAERNARFELV